MKRVLINLAVWLLVFLLAAILCFYIDFEPLEGSIPQQEVQKPLQPAETAEPMALLMAEKQRIEKEKSALEAEMEAVRAEPLTVMVLFSTLDENMLQEAAEMMDQRGIVGLLGISDQTLRDWQETGVPEYIRQRLAVGWELCLILENTKADAMQEGLEALELPRAAAGYMYGSMVVNSAQVLKEAGIEIVLDDGVRTASGDDGLWHLPAIGSMNSSGYTIYAAKRNRGEAVAYIIGQLRADQSYIKENAGGLFDQIAEDTEAGMVRNSQLQPAMEYCRAYAEKIASHQSDWDERSNELQKQLDNVLRKISSAVQ